MDTNVKITFAICLPIILGSCNRHSDAWSAMNIAQSKMEENPAEAMKILNSLNDVILSSDDERARYALLMSMSLDKNYIDTTDFTVLQPAIDYYLKYGNSNERLKTYYYQGRIYENQGDNENAMKSYVLGRDLFGPGVDTLTYCRLLVAQGLIFKTIYNYDSYILNFKEAATLYDNKNKGNLRFDCMLAVLDGYVVMRDTIHADSIMKECLIDKKHDEFYNNKFKLFEASYISIFGSRQELKELIESYSECQDMSDELKINLAYAYYKLGNNQQALDLLNDTSIKDYKHESQKAKLIRYLVYRSMGDVSQALDVFELYSIKNDSINEELFKHKVQTSEERHALQLAAEKKIQGQKNIVVLSIAFAMLMTVVVLILIILYRSQRNKKLMAEEKLKVKKAIEENLNMRVAQLEDEAEKLRTLLSSKTDPLPADVREALRQRIEMLNALLASEISDNDKYEAVYDEWIRNLTADNQAFMESNKLAFKASHPEFIKYISVH